MWKRSDLLIWNFIYFLLIYVICFGELYDTSILFVNFIFTFLIIIFNFVFESC